MVLGKDSDSSRPHDVDGTGQPVKERLLVRTHSGADSLRVPAVAASARHGRFPWRGVAWRFGCALLFSILIMVVLYSYAGKERLGTWDRRLFNTLTILFSSLVSLSLGSLLGLLGAALRWRLLARRAHQPRDVDLIFGMPNPTGALKLIAHDCGPNGRWSVTTLVVLGYLLVNIIGRLSVATFGLTYDLNENAGIDYPVMLNDFGSREWMQLGTEDLDLGQMTNFSMAGLTAVPTMYNQSDPSTYNMKNISGQGLDRSVDGSSTVTYTYHLREYRGLDEYSSTDRVVHSSSTCIGRNYFNGTVYEKGQQVANLRDNPGPSSPEFRHILDAVYDYYGPAINYLWAMDWDYGSLYNTLGCVTSYLHNEVWPSHTDRLTRNATFYECTTCLKDRDGQPGLGRSLLFNSPASRLSYAAGILLSFGAFERRYQFGASSFGATGSLSVKEYGSQENALHFVNNLNALRYDKLGDEWYLAPVPAEYELHTAHLAARLPILAIIGAERQLPRVTREQGASEQPFIVTSLEVKWGRAAAVLAAILALQLLAVAAVAYASRGLLVRDHDSFLAAARLLRTAVNAVGEGGSAVRGEKLAERVREAAGPGGIRYGTRRVVRDEEGDRERLEVDLWNDVERVFPEGGDYD